MANHTYTLQKLTDAVEFAAGGTLDSRMPAADVVNDALAWLCDYHPWIWLRKELSLNFVQSQSYVALPSDFKAIHNAVRNSQTESLMPVSLEDIHVLRAAGTLGATFHTHYAIGITAQATATAAPLYRLELYPTPTAAASAAIIGTYLRLVPYLTGSTSVPDIPPPWHPPLKWLCRAFAKSDQMEEPAQGADLDRAMAELEKLKELVGQPSLGPMRGAVGSMRASDRRYLRGTLISPT